MIRIFNACLMLVSSFVVVFFLAGQMRPVLAADDLLGEEAEKSDVTQAGEVTGEKTPKPVTQKKTGDKKTGNQVSEEEDLTNARALHRLPRAFSPIPRLMIIEAEQEAATPVPALNIAPMTEQPLPEAEPAPAQPALSEPALDESAFDAAFEGLALDEEQAAKTDQAPAGPTVWVADRVPRTMADTVKSVKVITGEEIARVGTMRLSDVLNEQTGAFTVYQNPTYNTPVIRGLSAKYVTVSVDGVRMTSPAFFLFGAGPGIDLVEPSAVSSMEVLTGANTLRYGSGALGGAIYLHSRGADDTPQQHARLVLKADTAESAIGLRGEVSGQTGRFSWFVAGGGQTHGDRGGGQGISRQDGTGYDQYHADAKLVFHFTDKARAIFDVQFAMQEESDLSGDRILGEALRDRFDPLYRGMTYLAYQQQALTDWLTWISLTASLQYFDIERERIAAEDTKWLSQDQNDLFTIGLDGDMVMDFGPYSRLSLGLSYYRDSVSSAREMTNRLDTTVVMTDLSPTLPDGATLDDAGVFLSDEIKPVTGLIISAGLRYDYHRAQAHWQGFDATGTAQDLDLDAPIHTLAVSGNVAYTILEAATLSVGFSREQRAPTLDELAWYGDYSREGSGFFTPNPNLDPETALLTDAGVSVDLPFLTLSARYFFTYLTDTIVPDFGTQRFENFGKAAFLQGVEAEAVVKLEEFTLRGTYTFTYGKDEDDQPLSLVPPHFGGVFLRWTDGQGRGWVELYGQMASSQDRLSDADKADMFLLPNGTGGWYTLNLRGGVRLWSFGEASASFANILDRAYRYHGSHLAAEGRRFTLQISAWF